MGLLLASVLVIAQIAPIRPKPIPPPPFGALYYAPVDATYSDPFWIDGPATLVPGEKYPLVVMFHGAYEDATPPWHPGAQAFMNAAKTWSGPSVPKPYIVVLHDGGFGLNALGQPTTSTYGNEAFHRATEAVLTHVAATWPVDKKRIYGYGHSMGGGECASFAARHQDPTKPTMLAAIVPQSGTVSVTRIATVSQGFHNLFQSLYQTGPYGTSPAVDFHYQRATALDLPFDDQQSAPLDYDLKWGYHLAHNLRWVPRANFHAATADALLDMVEPIQTWEAFLADGVEVNAPDQVGLLPAAGDNHAWSDVAPSTILSYFDARDKTTTLGLFSTQLPGTQGYQTELLLFCEDNKRHHCFSIERADPTLFGRLHVKFYPAFPNLNAVSLALNHDNANDNVAKTYIHVDSYLTQQKWSDPTAPPVIVHAPLADLGTIAVLGVTQPVSVEELIGTNWQTTTMGIDWTYASGTLSLLENASGVQRHWRINY